LVSTFLVAFIICNAQTVPKLFPQVWHTWVVTTVKQGTSEPSYNQGQLIMFDGPNQVACRYWEQNLVNLSTTRRADYCDYSAGKYYIMSDTKEDSTCSDVVNITVKVSQIAYPADFVATARLLGKDHVGQLDCNHFYAPKVKLGDGSFVQMDVWVDVVRSLPCQISTLDSKTQTIVTWAFDGFDMQVPHSAVAQCSIPKIMCAQKDWVCHSKHTEDPNALAAALGWTCSNDGKVNCAPINPGGENFFPDTLTAHCDWAFNTYYQTHRFSQGIDACGFSGLAELVPPSPSPQFLRKRTDTSLLNFLEGIRSVARVGDSVLPYDIVC